MASKLAKVAMMGPVQHTAGLFSDISVDGPEIGTLVVIVDRARNLPNRKTMGKQDVYCAARLGKEAKKTETDRRGGQTPKWDQELRFVVHDALDYHQLKVSVFSEDKRTDLVGDCWIPLDSILIPGGGKNDLWQSLNFKGKNAGEIRVELTFYDSRPREAKEVPPPRGSESMKPVRRRPLPADPTSNGNTLPVSWHGPRPLPSAGALSNPVPSARNQEPASYQRPIRSTRPNEYQYDERARHELDFENRAEPFYGSHSDVGVGSRSEAEHNDYRAQFENEQEEPDFNYNGSTLSAPATYGGIELPELPPHTPRNHRSSNATTPKYYTPVNSSPAYTLPQYAKTPEGQSPLVRERAGTNNSHRSDSHQNSPLRAHSVDDIYSHHHQEQPPEHLQRHHSANDQIAYDTFETESAPPPPRHSRGPSTPQGQSGYSPAPLNIRRPGSSNAASPLQREYYPQDNQYDQQDLRMTNAVVLSAPVTANHTPNTHRFNNTGARRGSVDPVYGQHSQDTYSTPPNKRPQSHAPSSYNSSFPQEHQQDPYRTSHRMSSSYDDGRQLESDPFTSRNGHPQQYAHREDAPMAKPRAISPAARATTRKSVSPRPSLMADEPGLRGVAFSPDSFDQFNPNMGSNPSSQVGTPEYSRNGSRGQDIPIKNEQIIGSDGRVIDPSDHLPSDTWAPEPEKKSPRKAHQINVKFRHIPQSTPPNSSPNSGRPLPQVASRPVSMATSPSQPMASQPSQLYATDDTMSQSGGRNRLHKRPPSHINSSPSVPHQQPQRTSPAAQPLREHANYGYNNNSPSYGRQNMSTGPPPIPAKIPMNMEQEDRYQSSPYQHHTQQQQYSPQQSQHYQAQQQYQQQGSQGYPVQQYSPTPAMSLSEEMSRIDIGSGGSGRVRRVPPVRYGGAC